MRNRKSVLATLLLAAASIGSSGCIDGVELGVQGGVESAIATVVENFLIDALTPGDNSD